VVCRKDLASGEEISAECRHGSQHVGSLGSVPTALQARSVLLSPDRAQSAGVSGLPE
jgi:hypothetical protein